MTDDEITVERDKQAQEAWPDFKEANPPGEHTDGFLFLNGFAWGWDAAESFLENQWKAENALLRDELFRRDSVASAGQSSPGPTFESRP